MAITRFVLLPGGRVKRFRNRQARCNCSKKTPGRPGLTRGICHGAGRRPARALRIRESQALREFRSRGFDLELAEDFVAPTSWRKLDVY